MPSHVSKQRASYDESKLINSRDLQASEEDNTSVEKNARQGCGPVGSIPRVVLILMAMDDDGAEDKDGLNP